MTENIRINGARLWDSIMEMAEIGATRKWRQPPFDA